ncbi:MAG: hypothetical protein VKJ09_03455 [Leptolyngbya sp.]|nr:hypothetical protein [Leptolyngbya sp.]
MASKPVSTSPTDGAAKAQSGSGTSGAIALRNFGLGLGLAGIPVLAGLWLSVDMTYGGHWAAVGAGIWGGAIALPLVCGLVAARWGQPVIRGLGRALESVQFPF